jgi:hypothetical protein
MARDFRRPERRQAFLLPPEMQDWLMEDDIVHLVLDAVSLMDLSEYEEDHRVGGVGQALRCTRFLWTPICPRRDRNDDVQHEEDRSSFIC